MGFNYTPRSAEDIKREEAAKRVLENGTYDFEVFKSVPHISGKSGQEMIKVTLRVFGPAGRTVLVDDYLTPAAAAKLRHFADTTGTTAEYEAGSFCAEILTGRGGSVKLGTEEQDGYPPRNKVRDYVVQQPKAATATRVTAPKPATQASPVAPKSGECDPDDCPF